MCICYKELFVYGNQREHENGILLKNEWENPRNVENYYSYILVLNYATVIFFIEMWSADGRGQNPLWNSKVLFIAEDLQFTSY